MAVTEFTSGPAGTGKTAIRCAMQLANDFLPHSDMILWTNFPVNLDNLVGFVIAKFPDLDEQSLKDRIRIIPKDVLDSWREYKTTPLDYFHDINLDKSRIAIDEIHNFCGIDAPKQISQSWRKFLGEIRHRGCEFECITQNESKVNKVISDESGLKRRLFNDENKPDPLFGIVMHDWYQLKAKFFTNEYIPTVWQEEQTEVHGKWKVTAFKTYSLDPVYFPLYDSYSAPHSGGNKSSGKVHPYQSKTTPKLIIWFLRRNIFSLSWRLALTGLVIWLCFLGGTPFLLQKLSTTLNSIQQSNMKNKEDKPAIAETTSNVDPLNSASQKLVELNKKLTDDLQKIKDDSVKIKEENEKLKKELSSLSEIVLICKNSITMRSGHVVRLGSAIPFGNFHNLSVKGINCENRTVLLSDDTLLYLVR